MIGPSISPLVRQSVGPLVHRSAGQSNSWSIGRRLRGASNYVNWTFFFFNGSVKVNDDSVDKNLGHNDHIDDDADALADLKR